MSIDEILRLLNDAENAFLRRRQTTSDAAEKAALTGEIAKIRQMRDAVDLGALLGHAAVLGRLSDSIESAVAALRSRPFDAILGAYQGLLDRIGAVTGETVRADPPAAAGDGGAVTGPRPGAGPVAETGPVVEPAAEPVAGPAAAAGSDAERLAGLYATCVIRPERVAEIDRDYVRALTAGRATYEAAGGPLGIPWWFVGILHGLECSFNFGKHLHNGDPLTARTVREPPGRPRDGAPPFTWLESAFDALRLKKFDGQADWSIGTVLDRFERYNGLGYRNMGLNSPYLWSFSTHWEKGKFVADHVFDPEAGSKQCGAGVLLKRLEALGIVDPARPRDAAAGSVATLAARVSVTAAAGSAGFAQAGTPAFARKTAAAELDFPGDTARPAKDTRTQRRVHRIQEWLNFHGDATPIDGDFGGGTEDAVRRFQTGAGLPATGVVDERTWALLTAPMHRALAPLAPLPGETLNAMVLRVGAQHLAEHPREFTVGGEGNRGMWVRLYMLGLEGKPQLWCAGFVSHIVGQAAQALGQEMPFRRQVGVDALVADAKASGRFIAEADLATPAQRIARVPPGSLFVVRDTPSDWTHVGIVAEMGTDAFRTIEGNTDSEGSSNGFEATSRSRGFGRRDFLLLV